MYALAEILDDVAKRGDSDSGAGLPPLTGASMGDRIRNAYLRAGLKRAHLAKAVDVSYPAVIKWEKGETRPNVENLHRIAEVTGVPVRELLGDEVSQPKTYDAFREFLATQEGQRLTPNERRTLEHIVFYGMEPTVQTYSVLLAGLRMAARNDA